MDAPMNSSAETRENLDPPTQTKTEVGRRNNGCPMITGREDRDAQHNQRTYDCLQITHAKLGGTGGAAYWRGKWKGICVVTHLFFGRTFLCGKQHMSTYLSFACKRLADAQ